MQFTRILAIFFLSFIAGSIARAQILRGYISDADTNEKLAYASIGVKMKAGGGIANKNGEYALDLSNLTVADTIVVSHIGYETTKLSVSSINPAEPYVIKLNRSAEVLSDFVVTAKVNMLTPGNSKYSGRFTGWGDYSSSRGRARGLQVDPKEFPVKVTEFVCRIKYNTFDSVKIRINLFKKSSSGFEQVLDKNIYHTVPKNAKWINVDLSAYNIVITDTVVLAIEWIDAWSGNKAAGEENNLFTISLGRKNGFCYERNTPNEPPAFQPCSEVPAMYLRGFRAGRKSP